MLFFLPESHLRTRLEENPCFQISSTKVTITTNEENPYSQIKKLMFPKKKNSFSQISSTEVDDSSKKKKKLRWVREMEKMSWIVERDAKYELRKIKKINVERLRWSFFVLPICYSVEEWRKMRMKMTYIFVLKCRGNFSHFGRLRCSLPWVRGIMIPDSNEVESGLYPAQTPSQELPKLETKQSNYWLDASQELTQTQTQPSQRQTNKM